MSVKAILLGAFGILLALEQVPTNPFNKQDYNCETKPSNSCGEYQDIVGAHGILGGSEPTPYPHP